MERRLEKIGLIVVLVFFTSCAASYNTNSLSDFVVLKGNQQYSIDKTKRPEIARKAFKQNSKKYLDGTKKHKKKNSDAIWIYPWECPAFE